MIWEEAIAFSERRTHSEAVNADTQGVVYCDVIRLWDFTFDHDEVDEMIGRIKQSRVRGQSCAIRKELKTIKNARSSDRMRCPRVIFIGLHFLIYIVVKIGTSVQHFIADT